MSALDQMTQAFNDLGKLTMKGVRQIHEKGSDAFVVILGSFPAAAFDKVEDAQKRARGFVGEGWGREQIRVRRVKV